MLALYYGLLDICNNRDLLHSAYRVPGTVLRTLQKLTVLVTPQSILLQSEEQSTERLSTLSKVVQRVRTETRIGALATWLLSHSCIYCL